jgi:hypothetical protein
LFRRCLAEGYEITDMFYDAAVSGADPVSERSGFAEMLERLMSADDHCGKPRPIRP